MKLFCLPQPAAFALSFFGFIIHLGAYSKSIGKSKFLSLKKYFAALITQKVYNIMQRDIAKRLRREYNLYGGRINAAADNKHRIFPTYKRRKQK